MAARHWSGALLGVALMASSSVWGEAQHCPAALAGSWYPGQPAELAAMMARFRAGVSSEGLPRGIGVIVSPHAGFVYSGATAAYGFEAAARDRGDVRTVVILAPSHHFSFAGAALWPEGAFETPLGALEVDRDLAAALLAAEPRLTVRRDVFAGVPGRPENSVETQLPFIKTFFPGARIVPVMFGNPPDPDTAKAVAAALVRVLAGRGDVLVDVSVDQSHFHPAGEATAIDDRGLAAIEAMDPGAFWQGHADGGMEVDGFHVVTAAMLYARAAGFGQARVLHRATSGDTTGDRDSVVGYASIAFFRAGPSGGAGSAALSAVQKQRLLAAARSTLETFVRTGRAPEVPEGDPRLSAEEGAFVTLHRQGRLRGCIGNIVGRGPLWQTVRAMTVAVASEDPRFSPVAPEELSDIDIEISVLSAPRRVAAPGDIEMGRHGVIVRKGMHSGVFLPQVAAETGWSRERFLSELCSQKAGLPPDCWRDPAVALEVFTADVFGEKESLHGQEK